MHTYRILSSSGYFWIHTCFLTKSNLLIYGRVYPYIDYSSLLCVRKQSCQQNSLSEDEQPTSVQKGFTGILHCDICWQRFPFAYMSNNIGGGHLEHIINLIDH